MTLPGKSPTFSVTTNSKGHLPDGTWSGTMYFVIRGHLQPLDWPQVAAGASDRPNLPSDRKWPQRASDRKWPQRASGRKWPQVAAEGKWPQMTASGRFGQMAASGRKWPLSASGRLFQFQIPHLMQPLWNIWQHETTMCVCVSCFYLFLFICVCAWHFSFLIRDANQNSVPGSGVDEEVLPSGAGMSEDPWMESG